MAIKYKDVYANIEFAKNREEFDNGNFQPTDKGKYEIKKAIQILEMKSGGNLQIYSKTGLLINNIVVSYDRKHNEWITDYLKKKEIEVK